MMRRNLSIKLYYVLSVVAIATVFQLIGCGYEEPIYPCHTSLKKLNHKFYDTIFPFNKDRDTLRFLYTRDNVSDTMVFVLKSIQYYEVDKQASDGGGCRIDSTEMRRLSYVATYPVHRFLWIEWGAFDDLICIIQHESTIEKIYVAFEVYMGNLLNPKQSYEMDSVIYDYVNILTPTSDLCRDSATHMVYSHQYGVLDIYYGCETNESYHLILP